MKILQVELLTPDIAATERFYSGRMRLQPAYRDAHTLRYDIGYSQLSFIHTTTLRPVYHIAFEIPANQLEEATRWLSGRASLISSGEGRTTVDFPNWNAQSVYFYDGCANVLEFIVRHDNAHQSSRPFDAENMINISEIGLACASVPALARDLETSYGLEHYEKQPPQPNFSAMGSKDGLLILSSDDRHWFPTDTPARKFPVELKFEWNGQLHELNYQ